MNTVGVKCVPSTLQPSCGTELVRVERGSTLNLQCGSYCSESSEYTWWKMSEQDETRVQLSFSGAVVTEDKVTEESGGDYECQCGSSGQICTFYVAGKEHKYEYTCYMLEHAQQVHFYKLFLKRKWFFSDLQFFLKLPSLLVTPPLTMVTWSYSHAWWRETPLISPPLQTPMAFSYRVRSRERLTLFD